MIAACCQSCRSRLTVNTTMVYKLEVFCPNEECESFVQCFWIDKRALDRVLLLEDR